MGDIEIIEEVVDQPETPEPKKLEDILKRYGESQKEMMEVLIAMFVRLEAAEKKLANPLLAKLLE